jgi:hypothetical protein
VGYAIETVTHLQETSGLKFTLSIVNVLRGPAFADPLQPLLAVFPDSLTLQLMNPFKEKSVTKGLPLKTTETAIKR